MTEEQIERIAECLTDAYDARLMGNDMTQAEYDLRMKDIDAWAKRERKRGPILVTHITECGITTELKQPIYCF